MPFQKSNTDIILEAIENNEISKVKVLVRDAEIAKLSLFLDTAVSYGYLEMVKCLLELGASPSDSTLVQLNISSPGNSCAILKLLMEKGVNINSRLEEGETLLMKAAAYGSRDLIELLVSAGADTNVISSEGETALSLSALSGHSGAYNYLFSITSYDLREGSREILRNTLKRKQRHDIALEVELLNAVLTGDYERAKQIIVDVANVDLISEEGFAPLHYAVIRGNISMLELFLINGADINVRQREGGETPLIKAIENIPRSKYLKGAEGEKQQLEIINALIQAGACINMQMYNGWSPLMAATNNNCERAVAMLLKHRANVCLRDESGRSALDLAIEFGYDKIVKILSKQVP